MTRAGGRCARRRRRCRWNEATPTERCSERRQRWPYALTRLRPRRSPRWCSLLTAPFARASASTSAPLTETTGRVSGRARPCSPAQVPRLLLLWALQGQEQKKSGTLAAAVAALLANKTLRHDPGPNPEGRDWSLHQYVEVAAHLRLIKDDTATLVRLTKDFRNLIHPGRAARAGQKCGRSTALGALAAVEAVARDLTPP